MKTDLLFYDGRCPLCSREIQLLSKLKRASLALVDIHSQASHEIADGISNNDLLSVMHLKKANGEWLKGLDATVSAWRHTKVGWLFMPLRWPLIKSIADFLYYRWAKNRACKLSYINT